ncbi:hypothetical protein Pmani_037573 [Petrolisthes manimaculis]|uniref:Uncharacterized protein n=1 Tax=Petrolisthes manimaculis TaxID=1843537 RepID=A0AAE1NHX7_9EUCA|nr:hypothetical protein Pmani_037573 [Petrolisthes manimaculis]
MAGDEEKKKKKKSKKDKEEKKEEEAPPPEPEPEPEPQPEPEQEPVAEPAPAEGEGEGSVEHKGTKQSVDQNEPTVTTFWKEEAAQVEQAPDEAPPPNEGEEALEPPPAPKKKPKFFVHWNRRKPRFYDYNWDYGDNYYSSLVKYMDTRGGGDMPRRMAFAERGIRSNVLRRTVPDTRTANLLDDVRKSIRNFELSQKTYMK